MKTYKIRQPAAFVLVGAVLAASLLLPRLVFARQENTGPLMREIPRQDTLSAEGGGVPLAQVLYLRRLQSQNGYELFEEELMTENEQMQLEEEMRNAWDGGMFAGWNTEGARSRLNDGKANRKAMPQKRRNGTVYYNMPMENNEACSAAYEPCLKKFVTMIVVVDTPEGDLEELAGRWKRYLETDKLDDWKPVKLQGAPERAMTEYSENGQLLLWVSLEKGRTLTLRVSSLEPEKLAVQLN